MAMVIIADQYYVNKASATETVYPASIPSLVQAEVFCVIDQY